MNTDNRTRRRGRLQLILVALIFVLPMVAASWMYFSDSAVRPASKTNHGTILDPIVNLPEELGNSPLLAAAENRWVLIYLQGGACEQSCRDALHKQRQARLMLGNDMSRLLRVLLHGTDTPDRLFLEQEHAGLVALYDPAARQLLADVHPGSASTEGYYLIDPLGNLVMYFAEDIAPRDLVDDIEHLLKLSRIG